MITRGIIEQSIDEYRVKVRIPTVDRLDTSSVHTSTDNLNTAVFATLPGCEVNLQPGDVVIVSVEDLDESAVIIGYLYRLESVNKHCSYRADSLIVDNVTQLSKDTSIGEVQATEIAHLKGLNENLQQQLDEIKQRLLRLEEK